MGCTIHPVDKHCCKLNNCCLNAIHFLEVTKIRGDIAMVGLTIGQTGQMLVAPCFWRPRSWISKHCLLVFNVFRLFTKRQNCRAFWLLHLVHRLRKLTTLGLIAFWWFKRIQPNSITLYKPKNSIGISSSMGVRRNFSRGSNVERNFAFLSQVADDAMQKDVYKTLCRFYPISLCWLNLDSQYFVWNVFHTSAIRNAFFTFWWRQLAAGRSLNCASCRGGEQHSCPRSATEIHSVAVDRTPNWEADTLPLSYCDSVLPRKIWPFLAIHSKGMRCPASGGISTLIWVTYSKMMFQPFSHPVEFV